MSELEFLRTVIFERKDNVLSETAFKVTYEYSWAERPNAENGQADNLISSNANSDHFNQCCWMGSVSFYSGKVGGEVEGEGS